MGSEKKNMKTGHGISSFRIELKYIFHFFLLIICYGRGNKNSERGGNESQMISIDEQPLDKTSTVASTSRRFACYRCCRQDIW